MVFLRTIKPPPTTHGAVVLQLLEDTHLLSWQDELQDAMSLLVVARSTAFHAKRAADEAKAQQEIAEATIILRGLPGKNEQERQAQLLAALIGERDYPQWQACRADAAQAALDAEAAQVRYDAAKAQLRAAAAAVGALGGAA